MLLGNQSNKILVSSPSFKMTTTSLPPEGRGISPNLSACRESQCNNHGNCVTPPGGGATDLLCNCDLGYKGDSCDETVNGALGLPLTLSVLAVLIGLAILAFVVAKYQRRKQKQRRKLLEQKA